MNLDQALPKPANAIGGVLCLCSVALLAACGSGSGDEGAAGGSSTAQIASVDVSIGDTSPPADGISDAVLQQNAARNAAAGININLVGVQSLSSNAGSLSAIATSEPGSLLNDALTTREDPSTNGVLNDAIVNGTGSMSRGPLAVFADVGEDSIAELDTESERLLLATLGLDDSSNAASTRQGNRITIDPDDAAVCAGETFIVEDSTTAASQAQCMELVSHLTVQLDAVTEQSGEITYLFNQQPLLIIGYGPLNAMYELKLGVLQQVELLSEQLSGGSGTVPATMRGAVRLVATVDNDAAGEESGTLALAISEPVLIEQPDGERFRLSPSTVFSISHDESDGTASLSLGLGAMEFLVNDTDSATGEFIRVALGGLTGRFDLSGKGERLVASNLGLVDGPMTLRVGDSASATLSVPAFGFTLSETSGELKLDTALNLGMALRQYGSQQQSVSIDVGLSSAAGTVIDTQSNSGNTAVKSGGPLVLDYTATSDEGFSETGYVSWSPGNCASASSTPDPLFYTCDDVFGN